MKAIYYILALLVLLCAACEDEYQSSVPNVKVNTPPIYLNDPEYMTFSAGSTITLDSLYGGYAGIIIYKAAEGLYYAYDRCCPLHVAEKEQLEIDGALAFCPTDSVYYPLLDGDPAIEIGNSTNPSILKSYKVKLLGYALIVYN